MVIANFAKSKWLLPSIAAGGAAETGYLAFSKLTSSPISTALCFDGAHCSEVLASPYAEIPFTNIPLVLAGFAGYVLVGSLSVAYHRNKNEDAGNAVLGLTSAMATFSAYLMVVLLVVLHESCTYCQASGAISFFMAFVAWNSDLITNRTKAAIISISSALATSVMSVFLFYVTSLSLSEPVTASTAPAAQAIAMMEQEKEKAPPTITKHSSPEALALAKQLNGLDAKMYGAYWCSHCFSQKQEFGKEAFSSIPYIECDKEGKNSQYSMCRAKKVRICVLISLHFFLSHFSFQIPGYPTWEIAGQYFPGEKTLAELSQLLTKLPTKQSTR